jgi:hypothetical protein
VVPVLLKRARISRGAVTHGGRYASVAVLLSAFVIGACSGTPGAGSGNPRGSAGTRPHDRDEALGWVAPCECRYRQGATVGPHHECEDAGRNPAVHVKILWATADGWAATATEDGVAGDCVYLAGWASESQYPFTTLEHRGAPMGGTACDSQSVASTHSWPEYVQSYFQRALAVESGAMRASRVSAGAFPPADSLQFGRDSLRQFRALWAEPTGYAVVAQSPMLANVSCVLWDGTLNGHAAPSTRGGLTPAAGQVACDDFRTSSGGTQ